MEKLNELVAALYPQYGTPGSRDVDVTERRKAIDESAAAIAEAFRALEQRAEAAEAKLAELEKQEPVYQFICNRPEDDGYAEWADCNADYFSKEPSDMRRILFTRPAPSINLAELVPSKLEEKEGDYQSLRDEKRGYNACIAAILRNIEEAK